MNGVPLQANVASAVPTHTTFCCKKERNKEKKKERKKETK